MPIIEVAADILAPEPGDRRVQPDLVVRWHRIRNVFMIQRGWRDPDPYPHREALKSAHWRWDPKEKLWYAYRAVAVDALAGTDLRAELADTIAADALQMRHDEAARAAVLREAAKAGGIAEAWPPVVQHQPGLLVLAGIWSDGQRSYSYSTLQIAGYWPEEAARHGLAVRVTSARGAAVERWRGDADVGYDGTGYHLSGKESRLVLWLVPGTIPTQLKVGTTYRSSGHIHYGKADAHYFGGPDSGSAYRSACKKFRRERALPEPDRVGKRDLGR